MADLTRADIMGAASRIQEAAPEFEYLAAQLRHLDSYEELRDVVAQIDAMPVTPERTALSDAVSYLRSVVTS